MDLVLAQRLLDGITDIDSAFAPDANRRQLEAAAIGMRETVQSLLATESMLDPQIARLISTVSTRKGPASVRQRKLPSSVPALHDLCAETSLHIIETSPVKDGKA